MPQKISRIREKPSMLIFRLKRRWRKALKNKKKFNNEEYIRLRYKKVFGREPNLENPEALSEKIQWLKLRYNNPLYMKCADKVAVRDYVAEKGLSHILANVIGVYTDVSQVDFETLPKSFAIKGAHGSLWNLICKDKEEIRSQWPKWEKVMRLWLLQDYSLYSRELHYGYIPPRLICEEFLSNPDGSEIKDYKFYCFNGEVKYIGVYSDRSEDIRRNFYDGDWNRMDIMFGNIPRSENPDPCPENLGEMLEISRILAADFPYVRVDLYNVGGRIVFGELTLTPNSGFVAFKPDQLDFEMGQWFRLPGEDSPYRVK